MGIYLYHSKEINNKHKEDTNMTIYEVRKEIKALILKKGANNILNNDLTEIHERTGATYTQLQNAMNYFQFSPQAAKYR